MLQINTRVVSTYNESLTGVVIGYGWHQHPNQGVDGGPTNMVYLVMLDNPVVQDHDRDEYTRVHVLPMSENYVRELP